jgi:type IV secretory pathway TrbD component
MLGGLNRTLVIAAGLVAALIVGWWFLTRRHPDE